MSGGDPDLSRLIEHWARTDPARPAIHFRGEEISYGELWRRIELATTALDVAQGERVAYLGYNHPAVFILLFALARVGAILVPLNWRLAAPEHRDILADCAPTYLVAHPDFAGAAAGLGARVRGIDSLSDRAAGTRALRGGEGKDVLIVYTSGTTGRPKGAVLTQGALAYNALNSFHAHDMTAADHVLTALPLFHVGGLNIQTLPALLAGARVTLHERFEAGAWLEDVASRRPTLSLLVPATMKAVIEHPRWAAADLSSLRVLNTGSMVVPLSVIDAFHARGVAVGQVYGATETAPIAIALRAEDARRKAGSAGKPVPHCEVKLTEGELWMRGPAVMRGYWTGERGLTEDGWFRSGDLARIDDEGFYWISGRSKELIISGGENIHPAELENVLADSPRLAEAAVVGVPDPQWGEVACAAVVPKPGATVAASDVQKLFEDRLARYKHPRRVVFLPALPRNAMGKVMKEELRRLVHDQLRGA